jgi:hypothetical protein
VKHISGASFYGGLLALPTNIRLGWKRNVGDKHSSLLQKFINYGQKKFYNFGAWGQSHKTFLGINLLDLVCKFDHFTSMRQLLLMLKMVQLTKKCE